MNITLAILFITCLSQDFLAHSRRAFKPTQSPSGPAELVSSYTPTTLRNNYSANVGMIWTNRAATTTVTALGRWIVSGNSGTHKIFLVRWSDKAILGSVSLNTSGKTAGAFAYVDLSSTVDLSSGQVVAIVSMELNTGDQWYDTYDNGANPGCGVSIGSYGSPVYANNADPPTSFTSYGTSKFSPYVPVSLKYNP